MQSSKFLYIMGTALISVAVLSIVALLALLLPYGTPTNLDLSIVRSTQVTLPTTTPYPTPVPWKGSGTSPEQYRRTPDPTRTPELGMIPTRVVSRLDPSPMRFTSRWRGWVEGKLVEVSSGSEGLAGDPSQGLIAVDVAHIWGAYGFQISEQCCMQIYRTLDRPGTLFIRSVDGLRFTLESEDGYSKYVFDLATRDWIDQVSVRPTLTATIADTSSPSSKQGAGMRIYSRYFIEETSIHNMIVPRVWTDAGSENSSGDIEQGILRITHQLDGQTSYLTPLRVGPIRIVGISGSYITVKSLDGQYTFLFNTSTRSWVSSSPMPTVLKLP